MSFNYAFLFPEAGSIVTEAWPTSCAFSVMFTDRQVLCRFDGGVALPDVSNPALCPLSHREAREGREQDLSVVLVHFHGVNTYTVADLKLPTCYQLAHIIPENLTVSSHEV